MFASPAPPPPPQKMFIMLSAPPPPHSVCLPAPRPHTAGAGTHHRELTHTVRVRVGGGGALGYSFPSTEGLKGSRAASWWEGQARRRRTPVPAEQRDGEAHAVRCAGGSTTRCAVRRARRRRVLVLGQGPCRPGAPWMCPSCKVLNSCTNITICYTNPLNKILLRT